MRKTITIALIVLTLGVIAYAGKLLTVDFRRTWQRGAQFLGQPLIPELDLNAIARLEIKQGPDAVVLLQHGNRWVLESKEGYPADFEQLKALLTMAKESPVVLTRTVPPGNYDELKLDDGTGIIISMSDRNGTTLAQVVLGKEHKSHYDSSFVDGRYVRLPASGVVAVVRQRFASAVPDAQFWMDKAFPRTEMGRRFTSRTGETVKWSVVRKNKQSLLQLDGPGKVNQDKLSQLEHAFAYAKFVEVVPTGKLGGLSWTEDFFELETMGGIVYVFQLGKLTNAGNLPVKITMTKSEHYAAGAENQQRFERESSLYRGWVYLLSRSTFGPMQLKRSHFVTEAPEVKDDEETAPMEMPEDEGEQ